MDDAACGGAESGLVCEGGRCIEGCRARATPPGCVVDEDAPLGARSVEQRIAVRDGLVERERCER